MSADDHRTIDLMGLYDVVRWGVIKTLRRQSVAEHSFGVAVIALELAESLGISDAVSSAQLMFWSLVHDAPETLTGDIDGKFKRDCPDVKMAIVAAERKVFPWYADAADAVPPHINALVKVADKIETIHYIRTWGTGTRADCVMRELTKILYTDSIPNLVDLIVAEGMINARLAPEDVRNAVKFILDQSLLESNSIQFRGIPK